MEEMLKDVTVAYVMIKAELGMAAEVAAQVSTLDGVHWAVVVTGPYDVIAGVRVSDNETLGALVVDGIQKVEGVRNPLTAVMTSYHVGGDLERYPRNGPP
jgi:DNA-binding Lrp family transcriptional regulator